jgi:hypothetical protein
VDRVPIRWTAGRKIEMVKIISVCHTGIIGTGEDGQLVAADYDELYEIGRKPVVNRPYESLTKFEKAIRIAVFGVFFGLPALLHGGSYE